ncbi:MAG: hypothetical protein FWC91_10155 [Defluviitaleaceae bacterium]|nr:hypothetical protein [Defluviitaleaceae bacterium]
MADSEKGKVFWHGCFFEGLQLDLYQYRESLSYKKEHELAKEFLIVDVMVIKKSKDMKIEKDIGKIFKGHNLIEFKSEKDSFSVRDYNKVIGYAYLYSSFEDVPLSDITVTIALTMYPEALERYLETEMNQKIQDMGNGVYYIAGEKFPVQILENKKLSKENIFLRNLRSNLTIEDAEDTTQAYAELNVVEPKNAYLVGIIKANPSVFKEVMLMSAEAWDIIVTTIEESDWFKERDKEKFKERDLETARKMTKKMKLENIPLDVILKITPLTRQEVEAL